MKNFGIKHITDLIICGRPAAILYFNDNTYVGYTFFKELNDSSESDTFYMMSFMNMAHKYMGDEGFFEGYTMRDRTVELDQEMRKYFTK